MRDAATRGLRRSNLDPRRCRIAELLAKRKPLKGIVIE